MQLNDNVWDKYCMESGINCTGIIEEAELPVNIEHLKQVAADSIAMPDDSLTYRWWMRRAAFHTLLEYDSIAYIDTVLSAFMDEYISESIELKIDSVRQEIAEMETEGSISEQFENLMNKLNQIYPTNDMESNLKSYTENYLRVMTGNAVSEWETAITNIANQCVFYGGPAVLEARAYLAGKNLTNFYKDYESNCELPSAKRNDEKSIEELKVFPESPQIILKPNFLSASERYISVIMPDDGVLEIYSLFGSRQFSINLSKGEHIISLPITLAANSFYLWKGYINGVPVSNGKLLIVY